MTTPAGTEARGDRLAALLFDRLPWSAVAPADWERLLSQARRANLWPRLAAAVQRAGVTPPPRLQPHLDAGLKLQHRAAVSMRAEVEQIAATLAQQGLDCMLLKGCAYLMTGLPAANGRLFGDIDLLVAHTDLAKAENALMGGGWVSFELDAYNQRYYRQWMHEVPPLTHVRRGSVIDLHHTIVPPTSPWRVDGAALLAARRPVPGHARLYTLQPVDLVLHSAVHLFTDGEFENGLRDLIDLHLLLDHFERTESDFWPSLLARAAVLGLGRPLWHAVHHLQRLAGLQLPRAEQRLLDAFAPPGPQRWLMDRWLAVGLRPDHVDCRSVGDQISRFALYVRSHALRMPLHLLLPHLLRKAWMTRFGG